MTTHSLSIGDRMKEAENLWKSQVPKESYVLLRLDGKAFHTYTKGLERPYDTLLMEAMDKTMIALCDEISGVRIAYTQSDEITLLITDWDGNKEQEYWMGGVLQKIVSLSAAKATAVFNRVRNEQGFSGEALFDSRLYTFPADEEGRANALDAFTWRFKDCIKNSVSMAAHAEFGHKMLLNVNTDGKKKMLSDVGKDWENLLTGFKYGKTAFRVPKRETVEYVDKRDNQKREVTVNRRPFDVFDADPDMFFGKLEEIVPHPFDG